MGYMGRVNQTSRGPWFRHSIAEDDGLEWFYTFQGDDGKMRFLLSSNMTFADREDFARLFHAHNRASGLAMFAGFYLGLEVITRASYFKKMAIGWKVASFFGVSWGFKTIFNINNSYTYGPIIGAYLRKYQDNTANDTFELTDRKREFYQIDTSQYMSYTHDDLEHGHTNYGPQPDGEARDASWLVALDSFLSGQPDHTLKDHPNFLKYPYNFKDKSFPTAEMANELITKH